MARVARLLCVLTLWQASQALAQDLPIAGKSDEPLASSFSLAKAAAALDSISMQWTETKKCGTCHTNYPYLMARPLLKGYPGDAQGKIRAFFEDRAANWDTKKPRWDTEVVATAAMLAYHDGQTSGKLHPITRQALDRMWKLQRPDGSWNWLKCNWPPAEADDYYGVLFAALGLGHAPDGYAQTPAAKAGIDKMLSYVNKTASPSVHHEVMRVWAAQKLPALMAKDKQQTIVAELIARQRPDGGWSLASLGGWKRHDGSANDPATSPSDGYATGLAVHVLRQTGLPKSHAAVAGGMAWLQVSQRESGRWFTRSPSNDRFHYISNLGTAYAVMALQE